MRNQRLPEITALLGEQIEEDLRTLALATRQPTRSAGESDDQITVLRERIQQVRDMRTHIENVLACTS
jgi:hypothetical protein